MKNLLVFTENYARGGGNRYLIDTVNGVAGQFDGVVIASNPNGLFNEDLQRLQGAFTKHEVSIISGSRIYHFVITYPRPIRLFCILAAKVLEPLFFLYNLLLLMVLIRRVNPSAVLSRNGGYPAARPALAMVIAARILRVPAALSIVSMPMARKYKVLLYDQITDYLVWRCANAVIVNADAISKALRRLRGSPTENIYVVYNGLEDADRPDKEQTSISNQVVIGCIARMDHAKGVLYLLDAFIQLASHHPEARLVLVGHGDASEELSRRVHEQGMEDRVELTGYYDGDIDTLLASFDIYVFPSLHEGFPYSILEAMRAGCSIVATTVGGIPEAICDRQEGLLVEPGSVSAFRNAIEVLLSDKELSRRLGANARSKFVSDFSLAAMHVRLREVFASAGLAPVYVKKEQAQANNVSG